jgi:hypothetical protein
MLTEAHVSLKRSLHCLSDDSKIKSPVQLEPELQQILQAMSCKKNAMYFEFLISATKNYNA